MEDDGRLGCGRDGKEGSRVREPGPRISSTNILRLGGHGRMSEVGFLRQNPILGDERL